MPSGARVRAFTNEKGTFSDATTAWPRRRSAKGIAGCAASRRDYDNDTRADLFVLGLGAHGCFGSAKAAASRMSRQPRRFRSTPGVHRAVAFADVDHDGDLDLFLAAALPPRPTCCFGTTAIRRSPTSAPSRRQGSPQLAPSRSVPTDYDNRRDVDLLVAGPFGIGAPACCSCSRTCATARFRDAAAEVGLPGRAPTAASPPATSTRTASPTSTSAAMAIAAR